MTALPVVVVVGRPNVGKSTLVNRIIGSRTAVVEELPGVTRDRREFQADWSGRDFVLVDTGGWEVKPVGDINASIREQAEAAVSGADVVLFVVDGTTELTDDDTGVISILRAAEVPVLLVANKVDNDG
ncbi:MAG: EngA family GTP-binding protein, partial [Acidimicrobiia bacterium]